MKLSSVLAIAAVACANPVPNDETGAVFAMTNEPDNQVIAFSRTADGKLTQSGKYPTGGRGQGVDFDTQGGLVLNADHSCLYAVNPADDKITVFSVKGSKLSKMQTIYGGDQPLSFTLNGNYAYALTGSVASTGIFGFKVNHDGTLAPLTNKTIATSTPIGVPGSIAFSPDGKALIVTNKVGSTIDVYAVNNGMASDMPMTTIASSGQRPFAGAFSKAGYLYVIESGLPSMHNAALSTYRVNGGSAPSLTAVTKSERNDQTDGCWVVITPDQKYAYTANFVSGTISSYNLASNGSAALIKGAAAEPGGMSQPVDLAMSGDGKFLYNLLRGTGAVAAYKIGSDGSLDKVGVYGQGTGLPVNNGASGLAVF